MGWERRAGQPALECIFVLSLAYISFIISFVSYFGAIGKEKGEPHQDGLTFWAFLEKADGQEREIW